MPGYIPLIDSISQMCFDWNVEESENYRFPNNSANIALIAIPVERRAARLDEPAFPRRRYVRPVPKPGNRQRTGFQGWTLCGEWSDGKHGRLILRAAH
jgi:hypothetical protein